MAAHSVAPGETRTGAARLRADDVALLDRLVRVAVTGLPRMYRPDRDIFGFTRAFTGEAGPWRSELRGESLRYSAIVALGARWLAEPDQRAALADRALHTAVATLIGQAERSTNLGDVALVCWAAAQCGHPGLERALHRLRALDDPTRAQYVVELSWVVSALAAIRSMGRESSGRESSGRGSSAGGDSTTDTDTGERFAVEDQLASARDRLLAAVPSGSPLFPHTTGPGLVKGYREHVACFADQVYPIQALSRLHASGPDPAALRAAEKAAARICELQGAGGQWWWHYDARTGGLIEGYPVYTVHQHAMAPMALFDLLESGGTDHTEAIRAGLRWIDRPTELGTGAPPMIIDDEGVTWRKVYRGDPRKVVRGLNTLTTRVVPGLRLPGPGLIYRPTAIDRECRPYEFGWLFFAWYGRLA